MDTANTNNRNYDSISPSARALLFMKGLTNIPFARQAAELMMQPEKYVPDYSNTSFSYWARTAHFESRYQSIDQLVEDLPIKNRLELSAGFSFRGLEAVKEQNVHYIDTDLPGIIEKKKEFIAALQGENFKPKGKLELLPLNALDEEQFMKTVNHFDQGPIVMLNEGLLMYLGIEEKEKLCSIIRKVLEQRGGYWITADIYTKYNRANSLKMDDALQQFFDQHRIVENMFDSMEAAEAFFRKAGFTIDKEAEPDYSKLVSLNYMLKYATEEQLSELKKAGRIHTTWRLKLSGD